MRRAPRRTYSYIIPIVVFLWLFPRLHIPLIIIGVLVVLFLLFRGCQELSHPPAPPPATQPEDRGTGREPKPSPADAEMQLLMGNPSDATGDPDHPDNFLLSRPFF